MKIPVGVLGATGMVGQNYIRLLENHPWFEVTYVAASPRSAGKSYQEAVKGRWQMANAIPEGVKNLAVHNANIVSDALGKCRFVFSALEISKEAIRALENEYATNDIAVVSNCSAHRHTPDVPMLIPEINHNHVRIIDIQRKNHHWKKGFVAVKPNCSVQSYMTPIYALIKAGFEIKRMIITTGTRLQWAEIFNESIRTILPFSMLPRIFNGSISDFSSSPPIKGTILSTISSEATPG